MTTTEKKKRRITRRRILGGILGTGAVCAGGFLWSKRFLLRLLRAEDPAPTLPPSPTGKLEASEIEALWEVFSTLGGMWNTGPGTKDDFVRILGMKTERAPSYLTVYHDAAARIVDLRRTQSAEEAIRTICRKARESSQDALFRFFVLREFGFLILSYGGFRQLGFANFAGHYGGGPTGYRLATYKLKGAR